MKKTILILLIFGVILLLINTNEKDEIKLVNANIENNSENYQKYYLTIPELNTNNFFNYFNDEDIIAIVPYVNPLYKNKMDFSYYKFTKNNLRDNINDFISYYKKKLSKYNFINDMVIIDYEGLKIDKVVLNLDEKSLYKIMKDCNKCTYEIVS